MANLPKMIAAKEEIICYNKDALSNEDFGEGK
jgi:hypothetical protein